MPSGVFDLTITFADTPSDEAIISQTCKTLSFSGKGLEAETDGLGDGNDDRAAEEVLKDVRRVTLCGMRLM
jgi:hypothetical protein